MTEGAGAGRDTPAIPPTPDAVHPFDRLLAASDAEARTRAFDAMRRAGGGPLRLGGDAERHAVLAGVSAPNVRLRRAELAYADLRGADFHHAFLAQADLSHTGLDGARLQRADLSHADCRGAGMGEADLRDALLEETDLRDTSLRFADLSGAALEGARIQGADLWGARLERADLTAVDLREAVIREARAPAAVFRRADLRGSSLMDTDFTGADFGAADLREAQLRGSDLSGADLQHARLQGVDLSACTLDGACWRLAQLDRTVMDRGQLGDAVGEERARDWAAAAGSYLALEQNFTGLGDADSASWAYRRRRRMQRRAQGRRAAEALAGRRAGSALSDGMGWLGAWVVELSCDYGESVARVFASLLIVFAGFSLMYGVFGCVAHGENGHGPVTRDPTDLALFSLSAMTSNATGLSSLTPTGPGASMLAGVQATLSIFFMGLLGFVAGNRIRR